MRGSLLGSHIQHLMAQVYILNKQFPADYFAKILFIEKRRKPSQGRDFRLFAVYK
jgi:hypothetical protein